MTRRRSLAIVVGTGLMLAVVACSSDDGADDAVPSTGSSPADGSVAAATTTDRPGTTAPITSSPPATAGTSSTAAPTTTAAGDTDIAWMTIEVVDASRPTAEVLGPDGGVVLAASPQRVIPTELVYPGRDGGGENATPAGVPPRPLVLWLNGLGGRATAGDPLLLALLDAGYIVAAPNVAEISEPVAFPGGFTQIPGDARAVLDALIDPGDGVADDLAPLIDPERVGLAGHSIGAFGVLGAAYHDCCRDERIDAVAVFAPPSGADFGGGEFRYDGTPLLIIHGGADQISPLEQSRELLRNTTNGLLVSQPDADHFQPVYGNDRPDILEQSAALLTTFFDIEVAGTATGADLDPLLADPSIEIDVTS